MVRVNHRNVKRTTGDDAPFGRKGRLMERMEEELGIPGAHGEEDIYEDPNAHLSLLVIYVIVFYLVWFVR